MNPSDDLRARVRAQVADSCNFEDEQRDALVGQIRERYGDGLQAILIYGSYLRGKRDTLLDFYVLLDGYRSMPSRWQAWLAKALPPNVYQIFHGTPPDEIRAKYALLSLQRFEYCVRKDFHSYFWARFAQPCGILYVRDQEVEDRVVDAICNACTTFAQRVIPLLPGEFDSRQLWSVGLANTYRCEFRSEPPDHAGKLYDYWPGYYSDVSGLLADQMTSFERGEGEETFVNQSTAGARRRAPWNWWWRRLHGKVLSTLRIFKAAFTFDGALEYLLWKIKRHSGVYIEPTPLQVRFPVIFAWPLLWKLWRRGAFQ